MFKSNRLSVGLAVGLLVVGVSLVFKAPALAVEKLVDGPHEFVTTNELDQSHMYSDVFVGHGRVVALETTYTQERPTKDGQMVLTWLYNQQELAEFNALALKYPFLESLDQSITSTLLLAEKLKAVPTEDATKISLLVNSLLERNDTPFDGRVIQKGFRIWSVDKQNESIFVPVIDPDANIVTSLGPTGLLWKEFKGGNNFPKTAVTILYYYNFATKKIISQTLSQHTVVFETDYNSAVVVIESEYFYWDLPNNKLIKFSSLFKLGAKYTQGGESQGSHYLGINLSPVGSRKSNRILWVDIKTKKTFVAFYPKGMVAPGEWHVYGEFAYGVVFDDKTNQHQVWQYSFKNRKFTRIFSGKLNVTELSLREIDGRNLWFEGMRPTDKNSKSESSVKVVVRFNADKKVISEWEAPQFGVFKDGAWKYFGVNGKPDISADVYAYVNYTRGSIILALPSKTMNDYLFGDYYNHGQPRTIREILKSLQAYRLVTEDIGFAKSVLPLTK